MTITYDPTLNGVALPVTIVSGGGGSASTTTSVTTLYTVIVQFTDGIVNNVGDILQQVQLISTTGSIISTTWTNLTQGATLPSAPSPGYIAATSANPLTDTQLRATPVAISSTQLPTSLGLQTASASLSVVVANPSSLDHFPVVTQYVAIGTSTGVAIGDYVQNLDIYDASTNPATLSSSTWTNLTQGTTLAGAPPANTLTPISGTGLTDAQLRASPVPMSTAQLPTLLGPQLAADSLSVVVSNSAEMGNFTVINQYLAIATGTDYNAGDMLEHVEIWDGSQDPAVLVSETWTNLTQLSVLASSPNLSDINSSTLVSNQAQAIVSTYTATNTDTEYNTGDQLKQTQIFNTAYGAVTNTIWINETQNTVLTSPPPNSDIAQSTSTFQLLNAVDLFRAYGTSTEYAAGDVLQKVSIYGAAGVVTQVVWNNLTQQTVLTSAPSVANVLPVQNTFEQTQAIQALYTAIATGVDYAIGDILLQIKIYDIVSDTVVKTIWANQTQNTFLGAAPASANISYLSTTQTLDNVSVYRTIASGTGYAAGDVLQKVQFTDASGNVNNTVWNNLTQQTVLSSDPLTPDIQAVQNTFEQLHDIVTNYAAIAGGSGYAIGDVLQQTQVYDIVSLTVVNTIWANQTQNTILGSPPASADVVFLNNSPVLNVISTYRVIAPGADYILGDILQKVEITTSGGLISKTIWNNLTQQTVLLAAPAVANIVESQNVFNQAQSIITNYICTTAVTGAAIGDKLVQLVLIDSADPSVVNDDIWYNQTQNKLMTTTPAAGTYGPLSLTGYFDVCDIYLVTTAFTGAAVGDVLENILVYSPGVPQPSQLSSTWKNLTQGTTLATAPTLSNLVPSNTTLNPTAIKSGQQTMSLTATAMANVEFVNGVVITADTTNTGIVYVGPTGVTASTGYPLIAGQSISYAIKNTSTIFLLGTNTTDIVSYTGN